MALTNSQYQAIIRDYDSIRDNNRFVLETRQEQVWQAVPEYRALEESIGSLSVSAARAMLEGETDARDRLHKSLAEIKQRQRQLLTAAGFPDDYLDPVYLCPLCRDTGYILSEDGLKQKCSCFRQREISVLYSQSHIQEMVAKENFSTLSTEYYQGEDLRHFEAAVDLCREFIKNFRKDYRNILFYGTVGTGKSFLSGCIAKELMDTGCSVIYFSAAGLFDLFARYSFDYKEKAAFQDFCEDIYSCDLLIIDDLGTEITNAFIASQLFSCLNERRLRKKSVLISTNLSLEEIRDRYSDRIFSRITSSFALCKLTGRDIRIYKKRAQNTSAATR
ncbi:MAG: ATP-binding protein [Butyrivibrio sp.]|nr:ATP-binding protein [Acetatifactor muris]MCM1558205.1 ATP-binding protein [Butyrivibrio sp.]